MKILFITDTHYTAKTPGCRTDEDGILETLKNKTKEVMDIASAEGCCCILHGGDFFDSPDISDTVAGEIGSLYANAPCPVFIIPGNHDLRGNNIKTLAQTKLGLLGTLIPDFHVLTGEVDISDFTGTTEAGREVRLTVAPSDFGINDDRTKFISKKKENEILIHMAHGMLLKSAPTGGSSFVPLSSICNETEADITLVGHYHLGFGIIKENGRYFVNPGALVRRYAFIEELDRDISAILIEIKDTDITKNPEISVKNIVLNSALPGEQVLSRDKLQAKIEYYRRIADFKSSFINATDIGNFDIEEIVRVAAKDNNIPEDITKEAIERVSVAKFQKGD